jgi:DNA-directed RNA polymerase subunit RPC12/RpoP
VEEQHSQGKALDVACEYCGRAQRESVPHEERAQNYQILIACAQCGNEFAAISRN